ncbi:hypothetical protein CHELA20_30021 [Hyphomicrobiales bacterium]|nr:hypothetical protein CHELA20_30021 [Hyphomicrobiales bacterium]
MGCPLRYSAGFRGYPAAPQSTRQPASSARGFPALRFLDNLTHFRDGLRMGDHSAGRCISHAALDTVDDFKLAIDIGGDGLAGEEGFASLRVVRDPVELFFHIGPNPNRHGGAGGHGIASVC